MNELGIVKAIDTDPALRLARYFATSEGFRLNLPIRCDLEIKKDRLETEVKVLASAEEAGPTPSREARKGKGGRSEP